MGDAREPGLTLAPARCRSGDAKVLGVPAHFDPVEGGTVGERYVLGRLLGRGATAEVRQARDAVLEREVAVKLLHASVDEGLEARTRFVLEAQLTAQLSSPHAVSVFDFGDVEGTPFLVMERMSGRTWADELRAGRPSDPRIAQVLSAVAQALATAHGNGIWHRDVKPANIMLADDGSAKLGDFGIAKSSSGAEVTRTGDVVGSFAYVSPERATAAPSGPAADVWAFGVVAYESYVGRRPFSGDSPLAVVHAVLAGTYEPLLEHRPDLPTDLSALVTACLNADPEQRPDADQLASAFIAAEIAAADEVATGVFAPVFDADDVGEVTGAMDVITAPPRARVLVRRSWRLPAPSRRQRVTMGALAGDAVIGAAAFAAGSQPDDVPGPTPTVTATVTRTVAPAVASATPRPAASTPTIRATATTATATSRKSTTTSSTARTTSAVAPAPVVKRKGHKRGHK